MRYDDYHLKGQPLSRRLPLDRRHQIWRAVCSRSKATGPAIEFRGFPPKARDDLVKVLGDKVTVQETDWNCGVFLTPNHKRKPFDDVRVRRALNLALDRWGGSKYLTRIAIVKTVGGVAFPRPSACGNQSRTRETRRLLAGHKQVARALAKKLLKEAGQENLNFTLTNRGVDQPYKLVGTWAIDQWRKIGVEVKQDVVTTPIWFDRLRKSKEFDVSTDANCQSVVNPIADVSKWLGSAGSNYADYKDQELEDIYARCSRRGDPADQRKLMREMRNARDLEAGAHDDVAVVEPHHVQRSYVKGWKTSPSHFVNQHLDHVWLDK